MIKVIVHCDGEKCARTAEVPYSNAATMYKRIDETGWLTVKMSPITAVMDKHYCTNCRRNNR